MTAHPHPINLIKIVALIVFHPFAYMLINFNLRPPPVNLLLCEALRCILGFGGRGYSLNPESGVWMGGGAYSASPKAEIN